MLADEDMVALQRGNLIDPGAPPVGRNALHAFLPHRFVATPIRPRSWRWSTKTQPDDSKRDRLLASGWGFVPFIKPGFDLARVAGEIFDGDPPWKA